MYKEKTLKSLFPDDELDVYQKKLPEKTTALWLHWEEFVDTLITFGRSGYTIRNVRDGVRFVIRHMNIFSIEGVNSSHFVLKDMKHLVATRGITGVTANTYIKNLRIYMSWLKQIGIIDINRLEDAYKFSEYPKEQIASSQEEIEKIEYYLTRKKQNKFQRYRNVFLFALMTFLGARNCEIIQIKCEDIIKNAKGYKIIIHGRKQKGRPRYYMLPEYIVTLYLDYMTYRNQIGRNEENLFISTTQKGGLTLNGLRCLFIRMTKETGVYIRPYTIRRFVATYLQSKGIAIPDISSYLGHTRQSTTVQYIARSAALTTKGTEAMKDIKVNLDK